MKNRKVLFHQSVTRIAECRIRENKIAIDIEDDYFKSIYGTVLPHEFSEVRQTFFEELRDIRAHLRKKLEDKKETQEIYTEINVQLRSLISSMFKKYMNLMGTPPHSYNVLVLGSLAGNEATPWSDVELVILVPEATNQPTKYFVQLSEWLTFTFIAFGETPVNLIGRCGFRLDTTKNPLGPMGLGSNIQTPAMMAARQLKSRHRHEPNYHLSGALLFAESLCGDNKLYYEYKKEVTKALALPAWYHRNLTRKSEFAKYLFYRVRKPYLENDLFTIQKIDIKNLYRDFQLILASLSLLFDVHESGLTKQAKNLLDRHLIPEKLNETLPKTINYILRLRMLTYVHYNEQKNIIYRGKKYNVDEMSFNLDDLEQLHIVFRDFAALYHFTRLVHLCIQDNVNNNIHSLPAILTATELQQVIVNLPYDSRSGDTLAQHSDKLPSVISILEHAEKIFFEPHMTADGYTRVAHKFMQLDQLSYANSMLNKAYALLNSKIQNTSSTPILIANLLRYQGRLDLLTTKNSTLALKRLKNSIRIWQNIIINCNNFSISLELAWVQFQLAQSDTAKILIELGNLDKAETLLKSILPTANRFQQYNCYTYIGKICLIKKNYSKAEAYLTQAIKILDELNDQQKRQGKCCYRNVDGYLYRVELALETGMKTCALQYLDKIKKIYQTAIRSHNPYAVQANINRWYLRAQALDSSEAEQAAQHSRAMARVVYGLFPTHKHLYQIEMVSHQLESKEKNHSTAKNNFMRSKL